MSGSTTTVSATASDNIGVVGVQFRLDGSNLGAEDPASPYSIIWNTALSPNGSRTLTAVARDAAGNTTTAAPITITVNNLSADATAPSVPTNLSAIASSASQINLTWTASTDNVAVTGYRILRNGAQLATSTSPAYSDPGLTGATTYAYAVLAYDAAGNSSARCASSSATTLDTAVPSVPASLTANVVSSSQINLSWVASTDNVAVTGYKIFRNGTQVATSTSNAHANTGLTGLTTYAYAVAAVDAAGNTSSPCASVSATTLDATAPSVPTDLSAIAGSASQINLTWAVSTDNLAVTGYRIFRNGAQVATSTSPAYSDTGLTVSTTYAYAVAAVDAAGNSSAESAPVSATTSQK